MATPPVPPPVPGPPKVVTPAAPSPVAGAVPPPPPPQTDVQRQATIDETPGEQGPEVYQTFGQSPFVQNWLPFLTSVVVHLSIIAVGVIFLRTYTIIVEYSKEPLVIPSEVIVEGAEIGGIPHPGLGGDETRDAAQDQFKDVPPDSTGIAEKPSANLQMVVQGGGAGDNDDALIAVGAASGAFGKGTGTGAGNGTGVGSGTGDGGGPLAPFGIPGGGGGIGPKSPFMGVSGNAMQVVYLCDSSGSMMNKFDTLRQELRKAADGLKPIQSFDIIFFSEDKFVALDKQLMLAVPEAKRKAYDFLDKTAPHGSSDPIPGLQAAFAAKPQLIYILTDGDFPNNDQVLGEIRRLNKDKKVKINTIAFMDRGEAYEKLLKQIADENGGLFKFVSDSDLQR